MSFYDNSSLAFLPSSGAGKDGKAYSIKPNDGTGDFTFSRGSNLAATRVGADGLIEKGRENLLTYSNDFSHSSWTKSSVSVTSGQTGYDGSSDAWLLTKSAGGANLIKFPSLSGVTTISIYAKQNASNWLLIGLGTGTFSFAFFNLATGELGNTGNIVASSIESVGNGFYRCSISINKASNDLYIYPAEANSTSGTSGSIYIQDAQVEIGLAATDYIESGATTGKAGLLEDEPRFDYSGGATCPSLLLEPSRTNLIEYSEYLNSGWSYARSSSSLSLVVSPDGDSKSYKFIETLDTNKSFYIYQRPTSVSGQTYTQSIFAKAGERNWLKVELNAKYAYFDLTNGVIGSTSSSTTANIEQLSNGWYRCSVSAITTSTAPYIAYYLAIADGDSVYDGDGTSGLYLWGGQYEQGSYPTSYIPNHSGGTITRGADFANGAGDASTFNTSEGVLYAEIKCPSGSDDVFAVSLNDGSASNRIFISLRSPENNYRAYASSSLGTSNIQFTGLDVTTLSKIAVRYSSSGFSLWVNGQQRGSNTFSGINALNNLSLDRNGLGELPLYGNAKQVLYFPTALSDADLATLTTL